MTVYSSVFQINEYYTVQRAVKITPTVLIGLVSTTFYLVNLHTKQNNYSIKVTGFDCRQKAYGNHLLMFNRFNFLHCHMQIRTYSVNPIFFVFIWFSRVYISLFILRETYLMYKLTLFTSI